MQVRATSYVTTQWGTEIAAGKKGKEQMKNNSGVCGVFDGVVVVSVSANSCTAHLLPVCKWRGRTSLFWGERE